MVLSMRSNRRRARLRAAAILAVIFVASYRAFLLTVGDTWTPSETVLCVIGTGAMLGAGGFLIAGLAATISAGSNRGSACPASAELPTSV